MTKEKKPKLKRFELYESQIFGGVIVKDPVTGKQRMRLNATPLFNNYIEGTCQLNDEVSLYITNKKPTRTQKQNRYLHLYLTLVCLTHEGNTVQDLKDWIHQYHLVQKVSIIHGVSVKTCKGTSNLKVGEFCEMLAWVEEQTGIPLPNTEPFLKPLTHEEYRKLKVEQRAVYQKLVMKKIK